MTPEEAIEIITNAIQTDKMTFEQDRALALAQKALKKQIPKEPLNPCGRYYGAEKGGTCPCCGAHTNSETYNYCRICGQALDWSDIV